MTKVRYRAARAAKNRFLAEESIVEEMMWLESNCTQVLNQIYMDLDMQPMAAMMNEDDTNKLANPITHSTSLRIQGASTP